MGLAIEQEDFTEADFRLYQQRLYESLEVIQQQMRHPQFGSGVRQIGAELESYIVDKNGFILPLNVEIMQRAADPHITLELNRYNLEINFDPIELKTRVFSELEIQMDTHLQQLNNVASEMSAEVVPIGILPTLRSEDLSSDYMTDLVRYRTLSRRLFEMRGEDFKVHIKGRDELTTSSNHVALEGANTSFQYHLMVDHKDFANAFNATQLITPLMLALSANSPILLGKSLWDETRIALFKQSIDNRQREHVAWRQPSRVTFGYGWVRQDAWELFAETVALYPPIFPLISKASPQDELKAGITPSLEELCLHMGTTWPWNRPVYCSANHGHVRIEMRALPAGPTPIDMCANAAFATGLVEELKSQMPSLLAKMPFRFAEYNFYRAAQSGFNANILWPYAEQKCPKEFPICEVIDALLPLAESGLQKIGIDQAEIKKYLSVIEGRLQTGLNGATWQKNQLAKFEQKNSSFDACVKMFDYYRNAQKTGEPLHLWNNI